MVATTEQPAAPSCPGLTGNTSLPELLLFRVPPPPLVLHDMGALGRAWGHPVGYASTCSTWHAPWLDAGPAFWVGAWGCYCILPSAWWLEAGQRTPLRRPGTWIVLVAGARLSPP